MRTRNHPRNSATPPPWEVSPSGEDACRAAALVKPLMPSRLPQFSALEPRFGCPGPYKLPAGGKPPKGEDNPFAALVGGRGFAPSPSVGLPKVITNAQGPLACVGGWLRFLRPLAVCDQALPRPTEGEDTQSRTLLRFRALRWCFCCAGALFGLACFGSRLRAFAWLIGRTPRTAWAQSQRAGLVFAVSPGAGSRCER
jgi:hypothetical protein